MDSRDRCIKADADDDPCPRKDSFGCGLSAYNMAKVDFSKGSRLGQSA